MKPFGLHIKELDRGCCDVEMTINGTLIQFSASYLGEEPLATLVEACACVRIHYGIHGNCCLLTWLSEPGRLDVKMNLATNGQLKIDVLEYDAESGSDDCLIQELHEELPFSDFASEVAREAWNVLNHYGLRGYRKAWSNGTEFPITSLIGIMMDQKNFYELHSDLKQELDALVMGFYYSNPPQSNSHQRDDGYLNDFHREWNERCLKENEATKSRRYTPEQLRAQSQRMNELVRQQEEVLRKQRKNKNKNK